MELVYWALLSKDALRGAFCHSLPAAGAWGQSSWKVLIRPELLISHRWSCGESLFLGLLLLYSHLYYEFSGGFALGNSEGCVLPCERKASIPKLPKNGGGNSMPAKSLFFSEAAVRFFLSKCFFINNMHMYDLF